jgi:hypothetical protein
LRLAAAAAGGAALLALPTLADLVTDEVAWGRWLFKGTPDGRILKSADGGQQWQTAANFGPDFQVRRLTPNRQRLQAELRFQQHTVTLASPDGLTWYTEGYRAPRG